MASFYISPNGSGKKDGSSAADAAVLSKLPNLVAQAADGDAILLLADQGSYNVPQPIILRAGGSSAASITIKGIGSNGQPMDADFIGTRESNWKPGAAAGQDVFRLMKGADNLSFENLTFHNVSNAFRVGADISNLQVSHATADNVSRFFENYVSESNQAASISGLVIDDVEVSNYAKGAIRLQYDTNNVKISNTSGVSQKNNGEFSIGVHLHGTVHDVVLSHVTMKDNVYSGTGYWNGDGFATEGDVYQVRFEHTLASGNADAGYDIKSSSTVLDDATAQGNNRNFRFWNNDTVLKNSTGLDTFHSGGTARQGQVHLADDAHVTIINSLFSDAGASATIFLLDQRRSTVELQDVVVRKSDAAVLSRVYDGSSVVGTPRLEALPSPQPDKPVDPSPPDGQDDQPDGGAGESVADGDNIYFVKSPSSHVFEAVGAGMDTILTESSYQLAKGQEIEALRAYKPSSGLALVGNEFANTLVAGQHGDMLAGGLGKDILEGRAGKDTFFFNTKPSSANLDHIKDFRPVDDTVKLENSGSGLFAKLPKGWIDADEFALVKSSKAVVDSDAHILYDRAHGALYYDPNGGTAAGRVEFAVIDNHVALTYKDFLIV